jgi:hypothetical protein
MKEFPVLMVAEPSAAIEYAPLVLNLSLLILPLDENF